MIFSLEGWESLGTTTGQAHNILAPLSKRHTYIGSTGAFSRPYLVDGYESGYALAFVQNGTCVRFDTPGGSTSDSDPIVIGCWFKARSDGGNCYLYSFREGNGSGDYNDQAENCYLGIIDTDIVVGRFSVLATAEDVIVSGAWNHVECKLIVADSGGKLEVRVNGITVIDFTGDTRSNFGRFATTAIRVGANAGTATTTTDDPWIVDHITIGDEFQGPLGRIVRIDIDADVISDWTPDTGSTLFDRINGNPSGPGYIEGTTGTASFDIDLPLGDFVACSVEVECEQDSGSDELRIFAESDDTTVVPSSSLVHRLVTENVPSTIGVELT